MIASPTLPDGWVSEEWGHGHQTISEPSRGGVTIDWYRRGYRVGWSMSGPLDSKAKYTGRGWKERLVADAVAHLSAVWR